MEMFHSLRDLQSVPCRVRAKEGQGGRVEVSVALLTRTQREKALTKNIKLRCRKTVFFFTKKRTKKIQRPQKTTERPEKHRNTEKKKGEKRNV